MLSQNLARELFDLAESYGLEPARAFQAKAEPADTAEQVKDAKLGQDGLLSCYFPPLAIQRMFLERDTAAFTASSGSENLSSGAPVTGSIKPFR